MPWIHMKSAKEAIAKIQEEKAVGKLTAAMTKIEEPIMSPVRWIAIEEICDGEWSIGG